jgi:uncharacterized protein (DUF433 family)/DNA-binding transcriptional MerR regulator
MYSTALASVLSGATVRQLQHWRRNGPSGPLLAPEHGSRPRCIYSYQDVVALRMVVGLRRERSLQGIRRAVHHLAAHHPETHLSAHRLRADEGASRSIVWITEDGDYVDVLERPGQGLIRVDMGEVLGAFRTEDGRDVPELSRPAPGLEILRGRCSSYPTVEGTRITFDSVASLIADGMANDDIRWLYPNVSDTSIKGAVELAERVRRAA